MNYKQLIANFQKAQNKERALRMEKYMRNQFSFFGLESKIRKKITAEFLKENKLTAEESELKDLFELFSYEKRECAYSSMELIEKWMKKNSKKAHYSYITTLITTNSWWDTVDFLASHLVGKYILQFPEQKNNMIDDYNESNNIWLQRSTLIFQLSYKEKTDKELLFSQCERYADSKEFFIQKGMGWALRQYAKTNPKAVYDFVDTHSLPNLTIKEANKHRES